jgi:hypothetical protein
MEGEFQVSGSKFQEGSGGVLEWWGLGTWNLKLGT